VMSGVVPPTVDQLRRVRRRTSGTRLWLLRTRRNADTISGAAPEVNQRTCCRGSRGSASEQVKKSGVAGVQELQNETAAFRSVDGD